MIAEDIPRGGKFMASWGELMVVKCPGCSGSSLHCLSLTLPTVHSDIAHLLREGDYMVGCSASQGLREIYCVQKTSFEESYVRSEASGSLFFVHGFT